jgi:hypothetical protein
MADCRGAGERSLARASVYRESAPIEPIVTLCNISVANSANVLQRGSGNDSHSQRGHTPPKNGANFHQLFPLMHICITLA